MTPSTPIVAATMLVLSFAAPVAAGQFEDADAAYGKGDYATTCGFFVRWPTKVSPSPITI